MPTSPLLERSTAAPAPAPRLPTLVPYPAINMTTLARDNAPDAFVPGNTSANLRPDRTLRSMAVFLATPAPTAQKVEGVMDFMNDPVTLMRLYQPTIAPDGRTYSLNTVNRLMQTQASSTDGQQFISPIDRNISYDLRLIPNTAMRDLMADFGLVDCPSPDDHDDDDASRAQAEAVEVLAPSPRRRLQLDYLRDAAVAAMALSDRRIAGLARALSDRSKPLQQLHVMYQGLRAQAQVKNLFAAPQFNGISETAKTYRAVDVQLQLGHVKKAEKLLRRGLVKAPDNQILLSRLALIEARDGRIDEAEETLAHLLNCPMEEAVSALGERTLYIGAGVHSSSWPLLAIHGFMLVDTATAQEGRELLHAAADMFPSRLLRGYRVHG